MIGFKMYTIPWSNRCGFRHFMELMMSMVNNKMLVNKFRLLWKKVIVKEPGIQSIRLLT